MAAKRVPFRAHDHRAALLGEAHQFVKPFLKFRRSHVIGESAKAGILPAEVPGIRSWAAQTTQCLEMNIADSGARQNLLEIFSIELWVRTRTWDRANVGEDVDLVCLKQLDEFVQGSRRMADGVDLYFLSLFPIASRHFVTRSAISFSNPWSLGRYKIFPASDSGI